MNVYVAGVFRGRPGRAHLNPDCVSIPTADLAILDSGDWLAATLEPCHLCGDRLKHPQLSWSVVLDGAPRWWLQI
jgi:hypothetical protein